ncbi:MAG: protease HtpX [Actinobacteria bacterium]|nr:MAG: protease HtpX [Actinomycetota bacterium]
MGRTLLRVRNVLKAWALLFGLCAVLGIVPLVTGSYRLLSVFLFCALLLAGAGYFYIDRIALGMVGARELPRGEGPALYSTVGRLAARARVPAPKLYILPDGYPRALCAGRGPRGSAIAVSRGLLGAATPAELEGVLAHELAHIRDRDVLVQSTVSVLAGAIVETSRIGGFLQRGLLFALGPLAAAVVNLFLSPKREFLADAAAAELCDSPHGLADALIRLEQTGELVEFQASPATEPLYTINPFAEEGLAALFVTHPPVGERVSRLRAFDPTWREKLRAA